MQPVDFSSFIQLFATFFIAFVAFDSTKSFSNSILKRIVDVDDILKQRITSSKLKSKSTELENIENDETFQEGNGLLLLQDYKKNKEKADAQATKIESKLIAKIEELAKCLSLRYISIYITLFCLTFLFISGIFCNYQSFLKKFLSCFGILSFIFTLLYLRINWSKDKLPNRNYVNSVGMIMLFFLVLAISFLMSFFDFYIKILGSYKNLIWSIALIISTLLPCFVCICYFVMLLYRFLKIRNEISMELKPIEESYKDLGNSMDDLLNMQRLEEKARIIKAQNNE